MCWQLLKVATRVDLRLLPVTCWSDGHCSHLLEALHYFYPSPSVFVRPLRPVALVNPLVGRRHPGDHQFKQSVPPGNQSDAPVGESPRKLRPHAHVSLGSEDQNVLRGGPSLHRPGDGQVGGLRELSGDVAGQGEVASFWDDWGRGLGGNLEGVGNNWWGKRQKESLINTVIFDCLAYSESTGRDIWIPTPVEDNLVCISCNWCELAGVASLSLLFSSS